MLAESVIEWTQDWKQQGLQQGLQQGKVALLERQLSKRFGPLNESTRNRLNNATLMHREEDCLIIEPLRRRGLLETLAKLPTLEEEFPDVDRGLLPLDSLE